MPVVTDGKGYFDQRTQTSRMQVAANGILDDANAQYEAELNAKYQDFMQRVVNDAKALRADLLDEYNTDAPTYDDYVRFQGDYKMARMLQQAIGGLNDDVNSTILDNLKSMYIDSYNLNSWTLDETTPPDLDINYGLPSDAVMNQFVTETWGANVFSGINAAGAYDIQKQVMIAMMNGDSSQDLASRIQNVIGDGDQGVSYQAKRIARTELLNSANRARNDVFDHNSDIMDTRVWVTRSLFSGRLCEKCAERSGLTEGDVKEVAKEQGLPLEPPIHPNCGCTWMPKLKSWQDLLPADLSNGMSEFDSYTMAIPSEQTGFSKVEPMSYTEWADTYLDPSERGNL